MAGRGEVVFWGSGARQGAGAPPAGQVSASGAGEGGAWLSSREDSAGGTAQGVKSNAPEQAGAGESGVSAVERSATAEAGATPEERELMLRVFVVADRAMRMACAFSSVPVEFLAALVANESGGNARALRFEPAVYDHLAAVAKGARAGYGAVSQKLLEAEMADALHPKAASYHAHFLAESFAERGASALETTADEVLRELATSWGFTQIMGYHMIWRGGEPRELLDPGFHFSMALDLLAQFAESYQLDVGREFRELFGCWNTGRPYGETTDPNYVENGLRRMGVYRQVCLEHGL